MNENDLNIFCQMINVQRKIFSIKQSPTMTSGENNLIDPSKGRLEISLENFPENLFWFSLFHITLIHLITFLSFKQNKTKHCVGTWKSHKTQQNNCKTSFLIKLFMFFLIIKIKWTKNRCKKLTRCTNCFTSWTLLFLRNCKHFQVFQFQRCCLVMRCQGEAIRALSKCHIL